MICDILALLSLPDNPAMVITKTFTPKIEVNKHRMSVVREITGNYALIRSFAAWMSAQILKCIIIFIIETDVSIRKILLSSGGMPSTHSATVCALCTSIAIKEGLGSPLFAISVVFAFLAMYDAMGIRRAAGEQAKVINNMIEKQPEHKPIDMQRILKEKLGHKPLEVFVGAALGITIALIFR